jgi:preprotein translocase subunit SecF
MRVFQNANYPIMGWRRRAYIITALLFLMTIGGMVLNLTSLGSWLNYGIDFTGGTQVQVTFNRQVSDEQVRAAVLSAGHDNWEISRFGEANQFMIRAPRFSGELSTGAGEVVESALRPVFGNACSQTARTPGCAFTVGSTEAVSAKVGDELQLNALIAILASLAATLIYLWYRFEWRFGLAAIAATFHDIFITLGILAVTRSEVSLATVAAFLTIVGYSLNDTIVVFDRIRENLAKPRHGVSYFELLNRSINETLPRTVLTGGSTIGCLIALWLFGGPVIQGFVTVLLLGIVIGTFSSIFVATPVLYFIEQKWPHKAPAKETAVKSTSRNRAAASA